MHRTARTTALIASTGAAMAIFAGSASATSSSITIACDKATFSYTAFGPPPQALAQYQITVDGLPFKSGTLTPAGPLSVFDVALDLQGAHVVTATTQGTPVNAFSTVTTSVNCPVPAPPPAVVPLVTPPGVTPPPEPPVRLVTCATLRRDGAGKRWLRQRGCIPRKVTPTTCADLRARGVGRAWLARRGCLRIDVPFRDVPVTG